MMYNWRYVSGKTNTGVMPSYTHYDRGFWSWYTYKQAVDMVKFAPELTKEKLRLIVSTKNTIKGHITDLLDRCDTCAGCPGKPSLLSWDVWLIYNYTKSSAGDGKEDLGFVEEIHVPGD